MRTYVYTEILIFQGFPAEAMKNVVVGMVMHKDTKLGFQLSNEKMLGLVSANIIFAGSVPLLAFPS